jgi:hypothetical protein
VQPHCGAGLKTQTARKSDGEKNCFRYLKTDSPETPDSPETLQLAGQRRRNRSKLNSKPTNPETKGFPI